MLSPLMTDGPDLRSLLLSGKGPLQGQRVGLFKKTLETTRILSVLAFAVAVAVLFYFAFVAYKSRLPLAEGRGAGNVWSGSSTFSFGRSNGCSFTPRILRCKEPCALQAGCLGADNLSVFINGGLLSGPQVPATWNGGPTSKSEKHQTSFCLYVQAPRNVLPKGHSNRLPISISFDSSFEKIFRRNRTFSKNARAACVR